MRERKKIWMVLTAVALAAGALMAGATSAFGAFYDLGAGAATGISKDGSVVSYNNGGAYIWTASGGAVSIGASYATAGVAIGGSGIAAVPFNNSDKIIVGGNSGGYATYWVGDATGAGSWSPLTGTGSLGLGTVYCTSATTNNFWLGGNQGTTSGARTAYRYKYSSASWSSLGLPGGYNKDAYIYGISDIGTYAGRAQYGAVSPSGARGAVGGSSLTGLNPIVGPMTTSTEAVANAISRDGSRAGGWSEASATIDRQATIWQLTPSVNPTPVVAIPFIGTDNYAEVQALNSDGTIAAGYARDLVGGTRRIWIWDAVNGTRDLAPIMTSVGMPAGWTLTDVKGISGDGLTITGTGTYNGTASSWVVVVPEPATLGLLVAGGLALLRRRR